MSEFGEVSDVTRKAMRANRGKDTKPEMAVRRALHAMGYRYRLHRRDLPGRPDIIFASRRKVIFVHGCFWHQHPDAGCKKRPASDVLGLIESAVLTLSLRKKAAP